MARAGSTSTSARPRSRFRLTAWFGPNNPGREPGPPGEKHTDYTAMDITEGGTAIPYWMEDPYLREEFADSSNGRRREPDGARLLQEGHRGAEVRGRLSTIPVMPGLGAQGDAR